jgi:hypothetical protein
MPPIVEVLASLALLTKQDLEITSEVIITILTGSTISQLISGTKNVTKIITHINKCFNHIRILAL